MARRIAIAALLVGPAAAYDVAIVGAGVAGLTAARTLIDTWESSKGPLTVTVLEAAPRIGGRTKTLSAAEAPSFGPSVVGGEVDQGASWIHRSCPDHPITRIRDALSASTLATDDDTILVCQEVLGSTSGCHEADDNWDKYSSLVDQAKDKAHAASEDESMWDAMQGISTAGGRADKTVQYNMANDLEDDYGASIKLLSGKHYDDDSEFSGPVDVIWKNGYGQVPLALTEGTVQLATDCTLDKSPVVTHVEASKRRPVNVLLGHKVTQIRDTNGKVTAVTDTGVSQEFDSVVMAAPLGVLQRGVVAFTPALSAAKQGAISRVGFGSYAKVAVLFDKVFWDNNQHYFGLIKQSGNASGPAASERFTYYLNVNRAVDRPVLMTFAVGSSAAPAEQLSDDEVWSEVRANLVQLFGEGAVGSAAKVGMWRSGWTSDPNFGGCYSYAKVGIHDGDWDDLAAPAGRVHFAGEHTSQTYRGTVHGAFFSGQRAACEILKSVEDSALFM